MSIRTLWSTEEDQYQKKKRPELMESGLFIPSNCSEAGKNIHTNNCFDIHQIIGDGTLLLL